MAAAFALRPLTLETQSRGKLHPHGHLYVAHSRVKNVASVHTYVAKYVAKGFTGAQRRASRERGLARKNPWVRPICYLGVWARRARYYLPDKQDKRHRQYTVPLCLGVRDPGIAELRSMRVVWCVKPNNLILSYLPNNRYSTSSKTF
eukprot:scaffold43340_cov30-Phaeocystis_antarctica.AAC.1